MKRPALLSIREVIERLNVSDTTVRILLKIGKLRGARIGRQWRVDPEELERYIVECTSMPDGKDKFDADRRLPPVRRLRFS